MPNIITLSSNIAWSAIGLNDRKSSVTRPIYDCIGYSSNNNETFEEKNTKKRKIKEKIRYYHEIVSYLLNGKTWDVALIKFLEWQKKRYRIGEKNDSYTIKEDIKQMQKDKSITDEIIDVALLGSVTSRENDDAR